MTSERDRGSLITGMGANTRESGEMGNKTGEARISTKTSEQSTGFGKME